MVEWDVHANQPKKAFERVLAVDRVVAQTVARMKKDTLVVFTADHSFDLRVQAGKKGEPLLVDTPQGRRNGKSNVRVDPVHTGEEVLVAAQGPGAERVRGYIHNTQLFDIMMAAFGWAARP